MHLVTLRMDRVFDVQPDAFSGNISRTLFGFESGGRRYFSVLADGEPKLQSGQTITAVLKRPGDWQTVLGIRIHETGEIFAPRASSYIGLLLLTVFASIIAYMELVYLQPGALAPVLAGSALVGIFFACRMMACTAVRRALRPGL